MNEELMAKLMSATVFENEEQKSAAKQEIQKILGDLPEEAIAQFLEAAEQMRR
jgi:hypothetical protein